MVALMATSVLVPGIYIQGLATVFVSALVIGFINAIIKPIFTLFTLPLTFITLGLFLFVINGLMLLLAAAIVPGFYVSSLGAAILGSIVISFINWVINQVFS
ncbi:MAG: phage holin family protein [Halanaerobiaceae bacterium]|jgi:putative membrane protein|nr:phage holin family protein [Halanaerobiaceae bacterium]